VYPEPSGSVNGGRPGGTLQKLCSGVLHELLAWDEAQSGGLFSVPVDVVNEAPGYLDVVNQPMDLSTMQSKVMRSLK